MSTTVMLGVTLVVFLGSLIQRVTGMGLALVASPFLVLILGGRLGVQTVQVVGVAICGLSAWALRRDINWRKAGVLLATSLVGVLPGAWVAGHLPSAWLSVVIGGLTVVALLASRFMTRNRAFEGAHGTGVAGVLSGFMNVTAGVGGPPVVIYANTTDWAYAEYVATVQAYFTGLNVVSLAGRGLPHLSPRQWLVVALSAAAGLVIGHLVGGRIDEKVAKPVIFAVALLGALAATARGILAL